MRVMTIEKALDQLRLLRRFGWYPSLSLITETNGDQTWCCSISWFEDPTPVDRPEILLNAFGSHSEIVVAICRAMREIKKLGGGA